MLDEELISEIQKDENVVKNLNMLLNRHTPLFYKILNRCIPKDCSFARRDDVSDDISFHFLNFAVKYDPDKKTKFSTHLANQVRWMCLNLYNKGKKKQTIGINDETSFKLKSKSNVVEEISKKEMFEKIIFEIESCHDTRIRQIFFMRYIDCDSNKVTPWKKISKSLDLSIQGCINLHNGFITNLQKKDLIKDVQ